MGSKWISVGDETGSIKIELEQNNTLFLEDVDAHYPGTKTLKFCTDGSQQYKSVKVRVS